VREREKEGEGELEQSARERERGCTSLSSLWADPNACILLRI